MKFKNKIKQTLPRFYPQLVSVILVGTLQAVVYLSTHKTIEQFSNEFLERHPVVAALQLTLIALLFGTLLYFWKKHEPFTYGAVEVAFGTLGCFRTISHTPHFDLASYLVLATATYIISRGCSNMSDGAKKITEGTAPKWLQRILQPQASGAAAGE